MAALPLSMPMSPTSSLFLYAETRDQPMHVAGLQLFQPPDGGDAEDARRMFDRVMDNEDVAPIYARRPVRSLRTLGQWAWETDRTFDLLHHVRNNALPRPGRILELLALCSRLHSTLLDRHRPLWSAHLIEGLDDGRFAVYFKVHHSVVDGVSALRLLSRALTTDPDERDMPAPWALPAHPPRPGREDEAGAAPIPGAALRSALHVAADAAGIFPALGRTVSRAMTEQSAALSFSAPRTLFNQPITGSRRFAAQSWPMERIRQVGKAAGCTVNDVVLAQCSGALREYLLAQDALPDSPLIAMVPVSLHGDEVRGEGGNAVGLVLCNLGTDLTDPAARLQTVHRSMTDGKAALSTMTPLQILAMSALGISPLGLYPLLGLNGRVRPPFNLIISNVPGPRDTMYWNGARLDGVYPASVVLHGQALNITVTSYSAEIAFGLTGCRRTVPHMQRLLGYLDRELAALEKAAGVR